LPKVHKPGQSLLVWYGELFICKVAVTVHLDVEAEQELPRRVLEFV